MNQERIYQVLLGPLVSEKATLAAEQSNQVVFKVSSDASKPEIKTAVEQLFDVKVTGVQTVNIKGKRKRSRYGMGKRNDVNKAYVTLQEGQDIDLLSAE